MTIFNAKEKAGFIATQSLHYDRYAECQYFLERVDVDGKCGLVYGEQPEGRPAAEKVILPPIYNDIQVSKISSRKAIYDKYAVIADGRRVGQFTLGLSAWVPQIQHKN